MPGHSSGRLPCLSAGLLIGGRSVRMGRPKHLLTLAGVTLAERLVDVLTAALPTAPAILGAGELPDALRRLTRVSDAPDVRGPLAGILAALRSRPHDAWLIVACDLPCVSVEALEWLIQQRSAEHVAVMPRVTPERIEPLLAVYEPGAGPNLARLAAEGRTAPRELAGVASVATPNAPPELAAAWTNVNTGEDWERWAE